MKPTLYFKIAASVIILLSFNSASGQEKVFTAGGGGSGSATSKKFFTKFFRFVDADTKVPLPGLKFAVIKNGTVINSNKADDKGYGLIRFTMSNYYPKVEINMNDDKYKKAEWKEDRNEINYKPVDVMVKFPSKKEVVDTVEVLLKRVPEPKK
ncbi:hypothetical protein [Pedobacter frigoris]|uniref:hypothetical protein n=1 Tax=Pedobacter frigoris TaxID=2571272 RepID=UPI0029315599|nr:hypothetical protein [Pedobacter frigoris]